MISATPDHDHHDADDEHRRGGGHDDAAERDDARDHEDDAERHDPSPLGAQRPDAVAQAVRRGWAVGGAVVMAVLLLCGTGGRRIHPANGTVAACMGHFEIPPMQAEMNETKKEPAPPRPRNCGESRPATTAGEPRPAATAQEPRPPRPCCWCARPSPATWPRRSKSSWWCAITRSTPSPARWCSPAASSRTPTAIRGCARAAAAPTRSRDGELKFRIAGVREAFEECGILLARKRGQRAVIAAADLKAHRGELARQARQGRGQHRRPGRSRGSRARHRPHDALRPLDHADLRAPALRHLVLPGRGAGGPDRAA